MAEKPKGNEQTKGLSVGNYELLQTIGEGAFAKVKFGLHRLTNLKTKMPDEYSIKNIHREAQILRTLDHPNIIKLIEVMETKKNLFLVLEYASGGDLLDYIVHKKRLTEDEAKRFARQIMSALDHAHKHNIVHRDLKAENLLLDDKLNVKISATNCGSPVYSAPELIEGKPYTGTGVDSWSLGINLYAMVVGDLPFADSNITALYDSISKGKYEMPKFVSHDFRDFISKLIVVNPMLRSSVSSLMDHKWLNENSSFLSDNTKDAVQKFRPSTELEIDHSIIEQMEHMGLERKTTIQAVITGKFNQSAGVYYCLAYQKMNGMKIEQLEVMVSDGTANAENAPPPSGEEGIGEDLAKVLAKLERQRNGSIDIENAKPTPPTRKLTQTKVQKLLAKPAKPPANNNLHLPKIADAEPATTESPTSSVSAQLKRLQTVNKVVTPDRGSFSGPNTTKFGIMQPNKNVTLNPIAIDANLYLNEGNDVPGMPRTIKFAFNCACHSPKLEPKVYFDRLTFILDKNDIVWQCQGYFCECEWGDIKFELELCKLPNLNSYGVRIKRTKGDIWDFKKLSSKFIQELDAVIQS